MWNYARFRDARSRLGKRRDNAEPADNGFGLQANPRTYQELANEVSSTPILCGRSFKRAPDESRVAGGRGNPQAVRG